MHPVICPVRSNRTLTERAVKSFLRQDIGDVCLFLIDNGCTDGTSHYLRSIGPPAIVTSYRPAKGLSYVWNQSLAFSLDTLKFDYALVVNNDVELRPDTYRVLVEDGGQFVTGVSVRDVEQTKSADVSSKAPHPDFSCFLIRRECWQRVGQFDETMVVYSSDGDYHLRMDKLEIDAYSLALPFLHEVSGTIKTADPAFQEQIHKQADADRAAFQAKWGFAIGSPEYYAEFRQPRENRYVEAGRL